MARASMEWRQNYEKKDGVLTQTLLQELIDKTKDVYAKASTIMRYGEEKTAPQAIVLLVATTKDLLDNIGPVLEKKDIKATKKKMEAPFVVLQKGGASNTLSQAKPSVEKLRAATRDMNKYLKNIKI